MARARAKTPPRSSHSSKRASRGDGQETSPTEPAEPAPTAEMQRHALEKVWLSTLDEAGFTPASGIWVKPSPRPTPGWVLTGSTLPSVATALTLRVAGAATPPPWAIAALKSLLGVALELGRPLLPNETLTPPVLVSGIEDSDLVSAITTKDQSFKELSALGQPLSVLRCVGVTADEVRLLREWSPASFLEVYERIEPGQTTNPERASLLASPRARTQIEQRVEREGSSLTSLSIPSLTFAATKTGMSLSLPLDTVDALVSLLKGRIGHQRPFTLAGAAHVIEFLPADRAGVMVRSPNEATLTLSQSAAKALRAQLRPKTGRLTLEAVPGLVIEIV